MPAQLYVTVGVVRVFRSVSPLELIDIRQTGRFMNLPGLEGKYFANTAVAAASFARQAVRAFGDPPYTIVSTMVLRKVLRLPGIGVQVDEGIQAYLLPNRFLSCLVPEIFNYSPLP